jgi:putative membrane protein
MGLGIAGRIRGEENDMRTWTLLAAAATLLTAALIPAQQRDDKFTDKAFVAKATSAGQFEVMSSELALQKSTNTDLKSFAQQMVNDHTKANQELTSILTRKGLAAPPMDQECVDTLNRLSKLQSYDFDREYGKVQLKAHDEAVELFAKASKECQDADLKAFATKTLPTLKEHQQMARRIFRTTDGR